MTADEKAALAGTQGHPDNANRFVTNQDARLANPRFPLLHAFTHQSGGSDVLGLDTLGPATNVTTLNSTTLAHGLLPTLSGLTGDYLRGDGAWASLSGALPIPTGTGFRHISAGVEDAASKLVENADVAALAAILESKLSLNFPTHSNANDPTAGQKSALDGTDGTPGAGNKYVTDSDPRNSNARTPSAHAATHLLAGGDALSLTNGEIAALAGIVESKLSLNFPTHSNANDPTAGQKAALAGTSGVPGVANPYVTDADARNTNARTPTAHAASHKSGGSDAIKLDELAAPTNITTLNATTTEHGLLPRLSNSATEFLSGLGTFTTPTLLSLSGQSYSIVSQAATAAGNGANLVAAYAAAKLVTPYGAALSATNRYTLYILPGTYTMASGDLVLDTQFIDIVGIGGNPTNIILMTPGKTAQISASDVLLANFQITTSAAGNATLSTDDYAFYPTGTLAGLKCVGMVFNAVAATNRGMRTTVNYAGVFVDCYCLVTMGFGGSVAAAGGIASGTFLRCVANGNAFGVGTGGGSANKGTANGTFIDCWSVNGGFGCDGDASGFFSGCVTGKTILTPYGTLTNSSTVGSFGGGNVGAAILASGMFIACVCSGGRSFGFNLTASGGTASGRFISCSTQGQTQAFGSSVFSGTAVGCEAGGTSFGSGTAATFSGTALNCVAGDDSFAGAGGNFQAAGIARNCQAGNGSFGGRTGAAGGAFAGSATNCQALATSFGAGTSAGTMSGTLAWCRTTDATVAATITGKYLFCAIGGNGGNIVTYRQTVTDTVADYIGVDFSVFPLASGANALAHVACQAQCVYNSNQNLTMSCISGAAQGYTEAGLIGFKANLIANTTATVSMMVAFGVQNLIRGGSIVTDCVGLFTIPFYNDTGAGTLTNAYGLLVRSSRIDGTATCLNIYGIYVQDMLVGTNKWGFYQAGATNKNRFSGLLGVGMDPVRALDVTGTFGATSAATFGTTLDTGGLATLNSLNVTNISTLVGKCVLGTASAGALNQALDSAPTRTDISGTYVWAYITPTFNPAGASSCSFQGLFYQGATAGAQNFSGTMIGINLQVLHGSSGSMTLLVGGAYVARKSAGGLVTEARGVQAQIVNANATQKIATGSCFYAQGPNLAAVGFMDAAIGLYIETQKVAGVTTGYGVYQVAAGDVNYFAGSVGIGMAAVRKLDVTGTFGATGASQFGNTLGVTGATTLSDTLAVTGMTTLSAAVNMKTISYSAAGALTIDTTHNIVLCDTTANNVTCNLPTAAGITGRRHTFKKTPSALNLMIIQPAGAETIDLVTPYQTAVLHNSITIVSDGTNWSVI